MLIVNLSAFPLFARQHGALPRLIRNRAPAREIRRRLFARALSESEFIFDCDAVSGERSARTC